MSRLAKDERIVVRMDAELRAWIGAEAQAIGIDDAAFVRMVLLERRRGAVPHRPPQTVSAAHSPQAPVPPTHPAPLEEAADAAPIPQDDAPADVDSIVARHVAAAERSGLTRVQRSDFEAEDMGGPVIRGLRQVNREPGKQWSQRYG